MLCPDGHATSACRRCQGGIAEVGRRAIIGLIVATPGFGYCIACGARLDAGHRYCWSCGAARWTPEPEQPAGTGPGAPGGPRAEERPPPPPGPAAFTGRPAAPAAAARPSLGLLPWFYAAGAVLFLVEA